MTGIKQFGLEAINFFVNTIIMGIIMVVVNLGLFDMIEPHIIMFNIVLGIFFFFFCPCLWFFIRGLHTKIQENWLYQPFVLR